MRFLYNWVCDGQACAMKLRRLQSAAPPRPPALFRKQGNSREDVVFIAEEYRLRDKRNTALNVLENSL